MVLEGGLRDRMMLESVLRAVEGQLQSLGWFGTNRQHLPLTIVDEYPGESDEVALNTIAVSMGTKYRQLAEMGSTASEVMMPVFIDIYAQNDGLGRHISGDISDFIHVQGGVQVYDYDHATPTAEFVIELVENTLRTVRDENITRAYQKHWYTVTATFRDDRT